MGNADLRTALALGWLVQQLAKETNRAEVQVAADLFAYLDTLDAELSRRGSAHGR
jgi:hypothetical protein